MSFFGHRLANKNCQIPMGVGGDYRVYRPMMTGGHGTTGQLQDLNCMGCIRPYHPNYLTSYNILALVTPNGLLRYTVVIIACMK